MQAVFLCLVGLMLALFVTVIYCALIVASDADDRMDEIVESKLIVPEVTPVPMPGETWVRYPLPLDDTLQKYIQGLCREYELPASVVFAVINEESGCDPDAKGDMVDGYYQSFGLMQIWASEHVDRCKELHAYNLLDPYANVRVGINYLAELVDYFDGDYEKALAFYNNDETGDYAYKILTQAECLWESRQIMEETND